MLMFRVQRRANPMTSRAYRAKSSSSSTPLQHAVSPYAPLPHLPAPPAAKQPHPLLTQALLQPQFDGLEKLYQKIKATHPTSFEILGFPCNQFGSQDPGTDDTIQEFCRVNYGVTFPVLKKTNVNGDKAEPLYEWMKKEKPGLMGLKMIKWNFEKFLIGADGKVKGRWASTTKPESLEKVILEEIAKSGAAGAAATEAAPAPGVDAKTEVPAAEPAKAEL
jgi:glutathione peroxidase-family protein